MLPGCFGEHLKTTHALNFLRGNRYRSGYVSKVLNINHMAHSPCARQGSDDELRLRFALDGTSSMCR